MDMFKDVLRRDGNDRLFKDEEQDILVGEITLNDKGETSVIVLLNLDDESFDYCEPHTCDLNHELGEQNSQRI